MLRLNFLIIIGFVLTTTFSFITNAQNCSQLSNGKYIIEYDENFKDYTVYSFEIDSNNYITEENGVKTILEIKVIGSCKYKIISNEVVDETKLSDWKKWVYINLIEEAFYEIYKVEGNSYYFRHIANYAVDLSGKFIKQ